jgi:hypothetical protein
MYFIETMKIDANEQKYFNSSWKIAYLALNNNHSLTLHINGIEFIY